MKKNTAPKKENKIKSKPTENILRLRIIFSVLAILLYGSTIGYKFTLDDDIFYLKHSSVQKGLSGVGELFTHGSMEKFDKSTGVQPYRPITLLSFAFEKTFFNNSAAMSHLVNLLFYVLLLNVMFSLLILLFPKVNGQLLAGIVLLFAAHPIHTEVVASVKSRDELLAALFGLLAWRQFMLQSDSENNLQSIIKGGCIYFGLSLMSKESAIPLLVLIPASAYMLKSLKLQQVLLKSIPLAVVSLFYLGIRALVLPPAGPGVTLPILNNILNGAQGFAELSATKMEILYYYLKLLFIPWPLCWDYSFNQIPVIDWSNMIASVSVILHLALLGLAIYLFRRKPVLSFSILFYFIMSTPTNNIFILNGATVGERFLFFPSFGFVVALLFVVAEVFKIDLFKFSGSNKTIFTGLIASVIIIYSGLTLARSSDWKNNITLFKRGVEVSPNSSRTHYSLATEYFTLATETGNTKERDQNLNAALEQFDLSLKILPNNFQALYNMGISYVVIGDTAKAIEKYEKAIQLDPYYTTAINNLAVVYEKRLEFDSAIYYYEMAYKSDTESTIGISNLANSYYNHALYLASKNDRQGAKDAYLKCLQFKTDNVMALNNVASLYTSFQQYDSALVYLKKGYPLDKNNLMIIQNIAAVSMLAKEYQQGIEYANIALAIDNRLPKSYNVLVECYTALGNKEQAEIARKKLADVSR